MVFEAFAEYFLSRRYYHKRHIVLFTDKSAYFGEGTAVGCAHKHFFVFACICALSVKIRNAKI
jgi:hypothetical protein